MADFADIAAEREQLDTARAIAAARRRSPSAPVPCGQCYNCDEPVGAGLAFCDADCRDDWQARRRAEGRA